MTWFRGSEPSNRHGIYHTTLLVELSFEVCLVAAADDDGYGDDDDGAVSCPCPCPLFSFW